MEFEEKKYNVIDGRTGAKGILTLPAGKGINLGKAYCDAYCPIHETTRHNIHYFEKGGAFKKEPTLKCWECRKLELEQQYHN